MAYSIDSKYGISVTHDDGFVEGIMKFIENKGFQSQIILSLGFPSTSLYIHKEDESTVTIKTNGSAEMDSLIDFFEEIVLTYKKYKSE